MRRGEFVSSFSAQQSASNSAGPQETAKGAILCCGPNPTEEKITDYKSCELDKYCCK
jgi:hypothetical protein